MATDWLSLQRTARREFDDRVAQIRDWHAPTPDTEWDVTDLVWHMVDEQRWIQPLLSGRSLDDAKAALEPIGDDLAAEWARFADQATAAWAMASPAQEVHLSYGTVPCLDYMKQQIADITVHTWDLARAIGADETLDAELVDAVLADVEPQKDMLASSGLFADPVPVPDDASPQDRLIALTGRDPRKTS
ncbi:TIGR03086 family metal-binding protein [Rhodococcus rhodochrous]|uniref:TIGR03086 family metal-binding protein n=1 Tax=Rhodococcus rhodochrous TaxID=1829 RepID=UPI000E759C50|nr:TIGR03086 family metal-binding protein [Rhodococcus rhodochrous]MDJ0399245.1 TIGR03086 family metal-binding protein [Rhodococcus rhodochrous]